MIKNFIIVFFALLSLGLNAANLKSIPFTSKVIEGVEKVEDDGMYDISEITIEEIESIDNYVIDRADKAGLGDIAMIIDQLIALGKKIWPIIENGKPVLNTDFMNYISVIPYISEENDHSATFYAMEGWSIPKAKSFKVNFKNLFGMSVISFEYTVLFQYSGKFNGEGNYLTGVTVAPHNIVVGWGFQFDASSSLMMISNHGSMKSPISGATLQIDYKAESITRLIESHEKFHVTGTGEFHKLN